MKPEHPYLNPNPPCDCGNIHAKWYGDPHGLRVYRCSQCDSIETAIAYLRSDYVQRNKHRMGVLGAQDVDNALAALLRKTSLTQSPTPAHSHQTK